MLDDPVVASPPVYRSAGRSTRALFPGAAAASVLAGLLAIGSLILPVQKATIVEHSTKSVFEVSKMWVTTRAETQTSSGRTFVSSGGTWGGWLVAIVTILLLVAAAAVLIWARGRSVPLVVGLVAGGLAIMLSDVLIAVSYGTSNAGANMDNEQSVGGGWWFLLAASVLAGLALILVWWGGRSDRTGRPANPVPAD